MKPASYLSTLLVATGIVSSYIILTWDTAAFPIHDKASNVIALWATVAAFISAAFVIQSYIQTNLAFVLSQKPHLRIKVENLKPKKSEQDPTLVHMTRILYANLTINPFEDLTIHVKVSNSKTSADLSDLFTPKMFMAGSDERQRSFITREELLAHGFEIESEFTSKDIPKLSISYNFTFNGRPEHVSIQQYIWNVESKEWNIA